MAGFYAHINAVRVGGGRLQVAWELRNGDLVSFVVVPDMGGEIGVDLTQFTGTAAQKRTALAAQLTATFQGIVGSQTQNTGGLSNVQTALIGRNIPEAP